MVWTPGSLPHTLQPTLVGKVTLRQSRPPMGKAVRSSSGERMKGPKEKASEQFPPVRGFSLPRPPARIVNRRLASYCVEKKEAPELTAENEEAPHGGERGF